MLDDGMVEMEDIGRLDKLLPIPLQRRQAVPYTASRQIEIKIGIAEVIAMSTINKQSRKHESFLSTKGRDIGRMLKMRTL